MSRFRKLFAPLVALLVLVSSSPAPAAQRTRRARPRAPARAAATTPRAASTLNAATDTRVRQLGDEYLRGHFAFNPTEATSAGIHEHDSQLETRDTSAVAREVRRLRQALTDLRRIPEWRLSPDARYDYLVLQSHAQGRLLELEEIRMWRRDPNVYSNWAAASVDNVLKRDYAPYEQRLEAMLARERQIPRLLEEARRNLDNPPRVYTETAIQQTRGGLDFFSRVVPQLVERAARGRLSAARRAEISATNDAAIAALRSFAEWLETDLLPRSNGDFRLGEALFRRKLLYEEMIETPPAELAREGEEELRRTQEEMRALAEEVAPGRGVAAALQLIGREHPSAAGLVGESRAELDRLRAFVRTEEILTPPARENLIVAETPEYARALSFASMDTPGPFERVATEGYYYVTPPEPAWSARQSAEHLSHYNRYSLPVISIHEAYPGHYYQLLALRHTSSRVRTALGAGIFVEGWAHYCEQMMLDEGYGGGDPRLRLAQQSAALLRLCRYLVAIRLHAEAMSYEGAVEFFMREGYLPRTNAEREARRGTLDPTYLVYTLGKMQILSLREEWRARMGDSFRLGDFHDRLLSYGMPPVKILRMAMLGDDGARGATNGNATPATVEQSVPVEFSVLATGTYSGYEGARAVRLISSESEWRRAWELIGVGMPLPDVNFNTRAVVVVYQGQQRTGGFGVEMVGARRVGTVLAIKVNERRPASGDVTTQALSSPFVAASIPKPPSGASVRFDDGQNGVGQKQRDRKDVMKPRGRGATRRRRGRR